MSEVKSDGYYWVILRDWPHDGRLDVIHVVTDLHGKRKYTVSGSDENYTDADIVEWIRRIEEPREGRAA